MFLHIQQSAKHVFDNLYGKGAYREISPRVFRFLSDDSSMAQLKISFERRLQSGWICALESSGEVKCVTIVTAPCMHTLIDFTVQIEPKDVDFWQLSAEQLTTRQNSGAYPPSFAICVTGGSKNDILKISFSGSMHDNKLTAEVPLSLLTDLQATHNKPISPSIPTVSII